MKKSELKQLIKEQIKSILAEEKIRNIVFENDELIISVDINAFVRFKGVDADTISDNYVGDAETAVQEWLDDCDEVEYENCEAGAGYVYNEEDGCGIVVKLNYL